MLRCVTVVYITTLHILHIHRPDDTKQVSSLRFVCTSVQLTHPVYLIVLPKVPNVSQFIALGWLGASLARFPALCSWFFSPTGLGFPRRNCFRTLICPGDPLNWTPKRSGECPPGGCRASNLWNISKWPRNAKLERCLRLYNLRYLMSLYQLQTLGLCSMKLISY